MASADHVVLLESAPPTETATETSTHLLAEHLLAQHASHVSTLEAESDALKAFLVEAFSAAMAANLQTTSSSVPAASASIRWAHRVHSKLCGHGVESVRDLVDPALVTAKAIVHEVWVGGTRRTDRAD